MLRIVSQNRNVDLPYEQAALEIDMDTALDKFVVRAYCGEDTEATMGIYSTKERAILAMAKLRGTYLDCNNDYHGFVTNDVFLFPPDKE